MMMKKKYKKYKNIVERFLASDKGKRTFNVLYSWGASVVILGALFKILHLPFGNQMLFIGMMTEFFVFFISGLDKPVKDYQWEEVFPVLGSKDPGDRPQFNGGGGSGGSVVVGGGGSNLSPEEIEAMKAQGIIGGESAGIGGFVGGYAGGPVVIGGGGTNLTPEEIEALSAQGGAAGVSGGFIGGVVGGGAPSFNLPPELNVSEEDSRNLSDSIKKLSSAAEQLSKMGELTDATQQCMSQLTEMADRMQRFGEVTNSLTEASGVLLNSYQTVVENSDSIQSNSSGYIHQMESLNRNISGLNTIYEIQLKSISSQIDTIERINGGLMRIRELYDGSITDSSVFKNETEKMAQQLAALNNIYARLLQAMTMNANPMYGGYPNMPHNNPNEK